MSQGGIFDHREGETWPALHHVYHQRPGSKGIRVAEGQERRVREESPGHLPIVLKAWDTLANRVEIAGHSKSLVAGQGLRNGTVKTKLVSVNQPSVSGTIPENPQEAYDGAPISVPALFFCHREVPSLMSYVPLLLGFLQSPCDL